MEFKPIPSEVLKDVSRMMIRLMKELVSPATSGVAVNQQVPVAIIDVVVVELLIEEPAFVFYKFNLFRGIHGVKLADVRASCNRPHVGRTDRVRVL